MDIERLLETTDDFELCNQIFLHVVAYYGDPVDVSKCKVAERVVMLVWQTMGIVDNGGSQYLFEGTYRGDSYFAKTLAAFRKIPAAGVQQPSPMRFSCFPVRVPQETSCSG